MPASMTPDRLTAIGMVGAVLVFIGYVASNISASWLILTLVGYVVQWFGDSLDGSLARFRRIERPSYGYFLDHSCDGLANLLIVAGIGLSPFVIMDIAMLALAGYFLMSIHTFLSARVVGELRLSYMAAGPTELRIFLMVLTVAMMILGPGTHAVGSVSIFDILVGGIGIILLAVFIYQTIAVARMLSVREPALAFRKSDPVDP